MQINWTEIISTLIAGLLVYGTALIRKYIQDNQTKSKIFEALAQGVHKADDAFVRDAKVQGPLTQETVDKARNYALSHAIAVAEQPIKEKLEEMTKGEIGAAIDNVLNGAKP